jgi:hypothetical protein
MWLYIADAAPTFVGVMAFALVLPYELKYIAMFKARRRGEECCRRTCTERPEIPKESNVVTHEMDEKVTSFS